MSLAGLIADDVSAVLLNTSDFAESVTRYPAGVTGSAATVTGVFFEDEPDQSLDGGESVLRRAALHISSDQTVDIRDSWLIRSELWQTAGVESANLGSRIIRLSRRDRINTHGAGGLSLL